MGTVEELAIDNATEGGVRETFGAPMATWQGSAIAGVPPRSEAQRLARVMTEVPWSWTTCTGQRGRGTTHEYAE
jgi:hypothetical protein